MLRPKWFEPEFLRRESERDDESGRDKRPLHHTRIFVDPAARYQKNQTRTGWSSTLDSTRFLIARTALGAAHAACLGARA